MWRSSRNLGVLCERIVPSRSKYWEQLYDEIFLAKRDSDFNATSVKCSGTLASAGTGSVSRKFLNENLHSPREQCLQFSRAQDGYNTGRLKPFLVALGVVGRSIQYLHERRSRRVKFPKVSRDGVFSFFENVPWYPVKNIEMEYFFSRRCSVMFRKTLVTSIALE